LRADEPIDLSQERERLIAAVREAGALALASFGRPLKSWTKGKSSPVSEADIAANEILRARLNVPGFGWLSEEGQDEEAWAQARQARRLWVVDPIDGTRGYLAGMPDWSVSAALVEDGRPVVAVLFAPVTDELFAAVAGAGATRNGAPIAASGGDLVAGARVAGPKPQIERLGAAASGVTIVARIHSLALRLARVAHGAIDAAFAGASSHDWDLAAADLLVHEAGGAMTDFSGGTLIYNRPALEHGPLVAAGRSRHAALLGLVRSERAAIA
jgi:myo-inositol-1(or 4)-monophosphatase